MNSRNAAPRLAVLPKRTDRPMKQAIILAAGRGRRLGNILNGKPKCLLDVGGKTLIAHQVNILRSLGIDQICVGVGYGAAYVYEALDSDISFVVNPRFADTNSLFSLWLTAAWINGPFMLMNSDVLAHPEIYRRVFQSTKSCLAYDSTSANEEEEMKIQLKNDRITAISKALPPEKAQGENVGIINLETIEAQAVLREADRLIRTGKTDHWSPAAINGIVDQHEFSAVDIADLPWTEVDFPEDLDRARNDIWHQVKTALPSAAKTKPHTKPHINIRPQKLTSKPAGVSKPAAGLINRIPAWPVA